jgi:hypothetical protein
MTRTMLSASAVFRNGFAKLIPAEEVQQFAERRRWFVRLRARTSS